MHRSTAGRRTWLTARGKEIVHIAVSLVLLVLIFRYVFRQFADISEVWDAIRMLTWGEIAVLVLATAWSLFTYWIVVVLATPGLTYPQAAVMTQSTTAVANSVPVGGARGGRAHLRHAHQLGVLEGQEHRLGRRDRHLEQLREAGGSDPGPRPRGVRGAAGGREGGGGRRRSGRARRRDRPPRPDPAQRGVRGQGGNRDRPMGIGACCASSGGDP